MKQLTKEDQQRTPKTQDASKKPKKSDSFQLRIDSELRMNLDIAARYEQRSASSIAEDAIKAYFKNYSIDLVLNGETEVNPISAFCKQIMSDDESTTFVNLALRSENLLNEKEREIWKFISGEPFFWKGNKSGNREPLLELIKACWPTLKLGDKTLLEDSDFRDFLKQKIIVTLERLNIKNKNMEAIFDLWDTLWPTPDCK